MITEYLYERIRRALVDSLSEIQGDDGQTFFFTPRVIEVEGFWKDHFDTNEEVVYMVRQGDVRIEEETSRTYTDEIEFWIMLCHKYGPSSVDAYNFPEGVTFAAIQQHRMVGDVQKKLFAGQGYMLGGLTENLELRNINYGVYMQGWVLVEMLIVAKSSHVRGEL